MPPVPVGPGRPPVPVGRTVGVGHGTLDDGPELVGSGIGGVHEGVEDGVHEGMEGVEEGVQEGVQAGVEEGVQEGNPGVEEEGVIEGVPEDLGRLAYRPWLLTSYDLPKEKPCHDAGRQ